ncbi:GSCOCG00006436001-RA-CDS, partial [Cotesia congregata]
MCGEWYLYESSLNVRSKDERCIKVKLEEYPVGKFKLISKSYITSISITSTVVTDVIVKNKDNGVLVSHVPLFGSIYKNVTLLTIERDYVILYSCQMHGTKRVESAWVFIKYVSSPPIGLNDKIENAFKGHNLKMPNMNSSDYKECVDVFSSYQFDPAPTPEPMTISCFLNAKCLAKKW